MSYARQFFSRTFVAVILITLAACAGTPERRAPGQFVDDAALTARVKTALLKTEGVKAAEINVNSFRGEVELSGFVENEDMIRHAVDAARHVSGVTTVLNDLHVGPRR